MVKKGLTTDELRAIEFDLIDSSPLTKIAGARNTFRMGVGIALDNCLTPEQEIALFKKTLPDGTIVRKEQKMIMSAGTHKVTGKEDVIIPESFFLGEDQHGNFYRLSVTSLSPEAKEVYLDGSTPFFGGSVSISEGLSIPDINIREIAVKSSENKNCYESQYIIKAFDLEDIIDNCTGLIRHSHHKPCQDAFYERAFSGYVGLTAEEMQLAYVAKDGNRISEIKNPSDAVKLAAVRENGLAVLSIDKPSDNLRELAAKALANKVIADYFPSAAPEASASLPSGKVQAGISKP